MRQRLVDLLLGDKVLWIFPLLTALILAFFVGFGHSQTSAVLTVVTAMGLVIVLGMRSLLRRKVLAGGILAIVVTIGNVAVIVAHSPWQIAIAILLIDLTAVGVLVFGPLDL